MRCREGIQGAAFAAALFFAPIVAPAGHAAEATRLCDSEEVLVADYVREVVQLIPPVHSLVFVRYWVDGPDFAFVNYWLEPNWSGLPGMNQFAFGQIVSVVDGVAVVENSLLGTKDARYLAEPSKNIDGTAIRTYGFHHFVGPLVEMESLLARAESALPRATVDSIGAWERSVRHADASEETGGAGDSAPEESSVEVEVHGDAYTVRVSGFNPSETIETVYRALDDGALLPERSAARQETRYIRPGKSHSNPIPYAVGGRSVDIEYTAIEHPSGRMTAIPSMKVVYRSADGFMLRRSRLLAAEFQARDEVGGSVREAAQAFFASQLERAPSEGSGMPMRGRDMAAIESDRAKVEAIYEASLYDADAAAGMTLADRLRRDHQVLGLGPALGRTEHAGAYLERYLVNMVDSGFQQLAITAPIDLLNLMLRLERPDLAQELIEVSRKVWRERLPAPRLIEWGIRYGETSLNLWAIQVLDTVLSMEDIDDRTAFHAASRASPIPSFAWSG